MCVIPCNLTGRLAGWLAGWLDRYIQQGRVARRRGGRMCSSVFSDSRDGGAGYNSNEHATRRDIRDVNDWWSWRAWAHKGPWGVLISGCLFRSEGLEEAYVGGRCAGHGEGREAEEVVEGVERIEEGRRRVQASGRGSVARVVVAARHAVPVGALLLERLVVVLEGGDAAQELGVWVRGQLDLDGLEADAEVLQLVVVFLELFLAVAVLY